MEGNEKEHMLSIKNIFQQWAPLIILVIFFLLAGWVASRYETNIQAWVHAGGVGGVILYIWVTIVAVVVAPISTLPLIPIASHAWGWLPAALYSIVGWVIGAQIAFLLARWYGYPLVKKIFSVEKITHVEERIPKKNLFLSVIFLRVVIPVDILSFALGLFSKMSPSSHFFATFIGVIPFAFAFSYMGTMPFEIQIASFVMLFGILFVSLKYTQKNKGESPLAES